MNTDELTPEDRKQIVGALFLLKLISEKYKEQNQDFLWQHFTDWGTDVFSYPVPTLVDFSLVELSAAEYVKVGDWHDYYPPTALRLTVKGKNALDNPAEFVAGVHGLVTSYTSTWDHVNVVCRDAEALVVVKERLGELGNPHQPAYGDTPKLLVIYFYGKHQHDMVVERLEQLKHENS